MFRIPNFALNVRVLLHRCHPIETQVASVSRFPPLCKKYSPAERPTCPKPPPPPPPPPKDERLLWGTIALFVLAGGFAVYAKESPEVRDWLSMNAPWFDDFIAILYQENMTFKEFALKCIHDITKYGREEDDNRPKECNLEGRQIPLEQKPSGPEDGAICDIIPQPGSVDICEIERCFTEFCEVVVNNYITARDACAFYNKEVQETMSDFTIDTVNQLHETKDERIELVQTSLDNIAEANTKLDQLYHYFECSVKAPPEELEKTKVLMQDCRDKIKLIDAEFKWMNDKSLSLDDLFTMVEDFVFMYIDEIATLIPGVDLKSKYPGTKMSGDPDLMLYHTFRYLQQLEIDLADGNELMEMRVDRGIESMTVLPPKEHKARENMINYQIATRRKQMAAEFAKRLVDQKAANDKALKEALKSTKEKLEESLKLKLAQKEKEAQAKVDKMIAEKVAAELKLFAIELDEMRFKLKMVEDKLEERLKAERETRRSQELYMAGAALLAATKKGDAVVRVDKELRAIEKASGDGDKLMQTVLKAIPRTVREQGIVPESILKERYKQMETVAMRVALVEADGAPLPVYILSFVQSLFLFMKLPGIPRAEIEAPPQEPSKDLDTFDLLQRARFWVETGHLAIALRYVNSLEGASRAAAAWWYEAARDHLETRQAAEAILAHAAALGLQYI
ncbi:MICOS complex subunit Mic60-like [Plodia interpunctella]|uniref:MICOS complex subunit Mic60-like n=1 Tax=Plodia interpunctella TaxID=58824 RepID=UPI002367B230|nr:MICOS complex subunit Mic60-like [Plodia interpunctella]